MCFILWSTLFLWGWTCTQVASSRNERSKKTIILVLTNMGFSVILSKKFKVAKQIFLICIVLLFLETQTHAIHLFCKSNRTLLICPSPQSQIKELMMEPSNETRLYNLTFCTYRKFRKASPCHSYQGHSRTVFPMGFEPRCNFTSLIIHQWVPRSRLIAVLCTSEVEFCVSYRTVQY